MAGQTTEGGLIAQTIGRYFTYRLLVIPAVALLMAMAAYATLRSNRVYAVGAGDSEVTTGQEYLSIGTQQDKDFALDARDAGVPKGGEQQTGSSYAIQGNDEEVDVAGTQEGYSNVMATTGFYVDWGSEDNGILSAFLGHLKKSMPETRVPSTAGQVVAGASEA